MGFLKVVCYLIPFLGGRTSASLHVARSVCRRAERQIAPLVKSNEVEPEVLKYVNRLSDYLFALARFAAKFDNKAETVYKRPEHVAEEAYSVGPDGLWKRSKPKEKMN